MEDKPVLEELHIVHHSTDFRHLLLPAWERIKNFCNKYESDADQAIFFEEICKSYWSDSPTIVVYVGLLDDEVKAHAVVTIDNYYGHISLNLLQYWRDEDVRVPQWIKERVVYDMMQMGKDLGVDKLRVWARNEDVANFFVDYYGFERDKKIILNTSLAGFANRLAELTSSKGETKEEA